MPKIIVDDKLCTRCNICGNVCVMSIIEKANDENLPQVLTSNEDNCMKCGHCEAFCPQKALTLDFLTEEKISISPHDGHLDAKQLALYLKKRRSVRNYTGKPVPKELITQILETARYAASGGNAQPIQWLVVLDSNQVKRISSLTVDWMRSIQNTDHPLSAYVSGIISLYDNDKDMICYNAPHLLFAHLPTDNPFTDNTDAIIAMTHFDIAAPAFGIGTCWAGFVTLAAAEFKPLQEAMALPSNRKLAYAMLFGYSVLESNSIPRRNPLEIIWRE